MSTTEGATPIGVRPTTEAQPSAPTPVNTEADGPRPADAAAGEALAANVQTAVGGSIKDADPTETTSGIAKLADVDPASVPPSVVGEPAKRSDAEGKAILDKALQSAQTRIDNIAGISPEDALKIQREEYEVARKTFAEVNGYEPVLFSHTGTEWVRDVDIAEESSAQGLTSEEIAKAVVAEQEARKAREDARPTTDKLIDLTSQRLALEKLLAFAKKNNLSAEEQARIKQAIDDIKLEYKKTEKEDGKSVDERFSQAKTIRNNVQAQLDRARESRKPADIALAKERYDNVNAYYNYLLWERRKGLPKKILLGLLLFLPLQIIFDIKNELQGGLKSSQPQSQ